MVVDWLLDPGHFGNWDPIVAILARVIDRYVQRLRCALTERTVILNKGLLVRVEKTVPLDKITDVGLVQGPIMRMLDLQALAFETAGQSQSVGATLSVVGVQGGKEFRNRVLKRRDEVTFGVVGDTSQPVSSSSLSNGQNEQLRVLNEIHSVLERIEKKLTP